MRLWIISLLAVVLSVWQRCSSDLWTGAYQLPHVSIVSIQITACRDSLLQTVYHSVDISSQINGTCHWITQIHDGHEYELILSGILSKHVWYYGYYNYHPIFITKLYHVMILNRKSGIVSCGINQCKILSYMRVKIMDILLVMSKTRIKEKSEHSFPLYQAYIPTVIWNYIP